MKQIILWVSLAWFAIGFLVGIFVTLDERGGEYSCNKENVCTRINIKSGCVYHSLSSILNPGYVASCELFRKRFDHEGIEKVFKK